MPPEQLPWDRRDFRKHDRSGPDPRFAGGGGGGFTAPGPHRWREQNRHPHAPSPHPQPYRHHHNQSMKQRWYSDFRSTRPIPPGRGKQGGWHMYPEEAGHGFPPFGSRYGDRNLEDVNFRPFRSRGDGRYLRNSRENRGPFSQKDWKSPSWEPPAASASSPGRPEAEFNDQKSIESHLTCLNNSSKGSNFEDTQTCLNNSSKGNNFVDTQTCLNNNNKGIASEDTPTCHNNRIIENNSDHTLPDSLSNPSHFVMKEKNEKDGGDTADELASSDKKPDKEKVPGTTEWKLKWNRSGSMSSRGSGFSRSSSSKSMGVDSIEKVVEVQQKKPTLVNSPAVCVEPKTTAPSPSDDTSSRKKPRLGWGEGLAKYEKKKVDDPEDAVAKDGLVSSVSTTETMQPSPSVNLVDKSPKVANMFDCVSPATPSLAACSSSPGIDEKESIKALNIDHDGSNLSCSPSIMHQTHCEGLTFNLENLDVAAIVNLSSLINEMVQSNDPSSLETGYVQPTSMNKLLVWKVDVLKVLEVTETEIDSLDTELKLLKPEPRSRCIHLAASSLIPGVCHEKPCEQVTASSTVRPAPLQVAASGDMVVENGLVIEDKDETLKDKDIDSPGSAVSMLIEPLPSGEGTFNSETPECFEGLNNSSNSGSSEDDLSDEDKTCLVNDHTSCVIAGEDICSVVNLHLDVGMYGTMLSSNKELIHSAVSDLEGLNNLLPAQQCRFDMLDAQNVSSVQWDSFVIKERFLMRKRSLLFKEKVITLKFKAFQHFWREGRIVSVSKLRGKSHKKLDLCHTGYKKNRSSSRSRISYSAGSSRKVPAEEVIEYVNGLLAESPFKPCRSTLKMPALILDKEIKMSRFISNNALVEDPCAAEKGRSMINPWTAEETEIFIDNLSSFGKDFSKIASFLERKTIADCIEFYYKNHKSECFKRAKAGVTKQAKPKSTTYLVANGKRWNREANAASLDVLGEASAIVANISDGIETQQKCTPIIISGSSSAQKAPRGDHGPLLERSNSLDNEAVAADVLAGICGSLSSEAMSSCITSSVDPTDVYHQDWKCQRCVKWPLTPDVTQSVDDECSDESCGEMDPTDWTDEEKSFFIQAVTSYGKDFAMISQCLRTKSIEQCKIFFSKARKCLGLYRVLPGTCNVGVSGDVNGCGGGCDTTEDACVVQTGGSVTCIDDSECKMEVDLPPEADIAGTSDSKPLLKSCVEIVIQPCSLDSVAAEPVSKTSSMDDDTLVDYDDKQAVDFNVFSKEHSGGANGPCTHKTYVKPSAVSINVESVRVEDRDECCQETTVPSDNDNKALVEVSDGHRQEDNEGQQGLIILPEDNLERKKVLDGSASRSAEELMVVSCMDIEVNDQLAGNVSHPCIGFQPLKKESVSQNLSLEQNECHFASVDSSPMLFSVPIKYQRHSSTDALSDIVVNQIGEKHCQKVVRMGGESQQHLSAYPLSDSVEPSQILRGYPVSVQTAKEMNGDFNCVKHVPLQSVSKQDGKLNSDLSFRKCSTGLRNWSENVPPTSQESSGDHSRPDGVDKSQPSRNGDVKLFGKILISSQKNTNSCDYDDNNNNNGQRHKSSHLQLLNLKFSGHQKVNLDSFQSKVDISNYLAPGKNINNIPFKGVGWDENRTKPSIFPLPDSTLLLAKYPAAFSNHHPTPTVKMDEPPFGGIIRSNGHHPFNGVSVFQNRETSNDIADYQLRSRELQSFSVDMNQSQDVFSEMQSNVSGVVQGMQSMVGIDVVGRGGVLAAEGQCADVSDPVTAINMHNANAQNIIVKANGNIIREDDMWRSSNGDVGR